MRCILISLSAFVICICQVLVGKRMEKEESGVEDNLFESSVLPPYIPNADNPHICVTMDTAIAFVNRLELSTFYDYCVSINASNFMNYDQWQNAILWVIQRKITLVIKFWEIQDFVIL
jgi:hypothetical protein